MTLGETKHASPTWLDRIHDALAAGPIGRAVVLATFGSTPREAGAHMLVNARGLIDGTIGGGQLEHQAIARIRSLLTMPTIHRPAIHREVQRLQLGPDTGQCCGGAVDIGLEIYPATTRPALTALLASHPRAMRVDWTGPGVPTAVDMAPDAAPFTWTDEQGERATIEHLHRCRTPLWLFGAGHVGRAVVRALQDLPIAITWIDTHADRFPPDLVQRATATIVSVVAEDPASLIIRAPANALHLVMTYAHDLDADVCRAILRRDAFRWLGLIGSKTKAARFRQAFSRDGLDPAVVARLVCPVGIADIGSKEPAFVGIAIAAAIAREVAVSNQRPAGDPSR